MINKKREVCCSLCQDLRLEKLKALFAKDLAKVGNIVTENKLVAKANASQFIHVKKKIHVSKNKLNFAARNQK